MKFKFIYIFLATLINSSLLMYAQEKGSAEYYELMLEEKLEEIPELNKEINISMPQASIQEFLRGVAKFSGLNLDISPELDFVVTNNFSRVKAKDIIIFLCVQYDLELTFIGTIVSISKKPENISIDKLNIKYDKDKNLITLDYKNESLVRVVREITILTGNNVILSPGIENNVVSGYIQNMPFDNAMDKFAFTNNLSLKKSEDGFYVLSLKKDTAVGDPQMVQRAQQQQQLNRPYTNRNGQNQGRNQQNNQDEFLLDVKMLGPDSISILTQDAPLLDIISEVSKEAGVDYFIVSDLQGTLSLSIKGSGYLDFLNFAMQNTPYTYKLTDGIIVIGEKTSTELKYTKVVQMQNRTIDKILDFIPADLKKDIEIIEFAELNSLLVTGPESNIANVEMFLKAIDKPVPVIMIELIIVDVNKKYTISTGINAGLGEEPAVTGGKVFPGVDMTFGSNSVNNIISGMDDYGWLNIGKVTPNFYVTLKALEEQGILNVRSTPKLSTLNGHEATLSIGNSEYYLEEQSNIYGTQNPQLSTTQTYKPVEATLSLKIKPIVSSNDQITMEIDVQQSDFTERISPTAPPGKVSRSFQSTIRVKNQETILLGGLEEKRTNDTGSGTPILSRIPVIKWFFSSRTKEDSNSRLNILIKPTILN